MRNNPFIPSPRYEIDRLFDTLVHTAWGGGPEGSCWCPSVDVTEEPRVYRLEMDLPGVQISDVSITADRGVLKIEGTRQRVRRSVSEHHHLVERTCGTFARTFRLPEDADPEGIRARLSDGVLTVEIMRK